MKQKAKPMDWTGRDSLVVVMMITIIIVIILVISYEDRLCLDRYITNYVISETVCVFLCAGVDGG